MNRSQTHSATLKLNKTLVFLLLLFLFIAMKALSAMEFQKQALQLHSPEQSSQTDIRISASMVTDTNKHTGNQSYEIKN